MTNETDLRECSAQIELIRQLIDQPETFDLDKVLIELETKKKLLMTFGPRDYATILKGLESGGLIHPNIAAAKQLSETKQLKVLAEEKAKLVAEKKLEAEEAKAFQLKKQEDERVKAEKLKAAAIKAEKIAAKKAELVALEAKEVEE